MRKLAKLCRINQRMLIQKKWLDFSKSSEHHGILISYIPPTSSQFCCAVLSHSVMSDPLWLLPARLLCSCGFSGQEYWSGLPCPLHTIMLKTWQPPEGAEQGWSSSKPMSLFDLSSSWFPERSFLQGWLCLTSSRGWPLWRPFPRGIC